MVACIATFTRDGDADFARLDKAVADRVLKKLKWLAENLDNITPEQLTGEWAGVFKLVIGDYRALYTFDKTQQTITVRVVKHRSEVYKRK